MLRIVHLSDLHFGAVRSALARSLPAVVSELCPRLVVVSGDLTQRARSSQFKAAARFLDRLDFPKVVVPGNHDIPLWNVAHRFFTPLARYRKYIGSDPEPVYRDDDLFVAGVTTARSSTRKSGRISHEQIERLQARLGTIPSHVFKAVVMHHPLAPSEEHEGIPIVGRADMALEVLTREAVDVVFAGHVHHGFTCRTAEKDKGPRHSVLVVQGGSAISRRTRGYPNGFNLLEIEGEQIDLTPYEWSQTEQRFAATDPARFRNRGVWDVIAGPEQGDRGDSRNGRRDFLCK
jgi:3',5'-cyclic AMP phosphodiesterase CpdA